MAKKILGLFLMLALFFSFTMTEALALDDMPEKPDKLNIIALDIDVDQFGEGVEIFEEKYGIEVEWMEYPYGDLWNQITTSITGGSTVDLYMMSRSWHAELGQLGLAMPLDEIVSEEELAAVNEKFFDATVEFVSSHGHQWAIPGTAATVSFFYNEAILSELGYEEPPATWDEMLDISREAIDAGLASYGFFPGWLAGHEDGMVWFDLLLRLHNGRWLNEDRTEWVFNNEEGVKTLEFMKDILDEGLIPQAALEVTDWDNFHYFLAGDQPFEINWNFVYQAAIDPDQSDIVDDFAVGHIPGIERESYTLMGGGGYAISPTTRSPEWSFKLLDYMHREEGALGVMAEQAGAEAVIEDIYLNYEDYGLTLEEYPMIEVFQEQMEYASVEPYGRPSGYLTWYSEFRDNIFTPAMHRALQGEQDIQEALDEAQQEAQQMLEAEGL